MCHFDIVLSDLGEILKVKRTYILFISLLCALFACGWGITRPTLYMAEATFRDKAKADSGIRQSVNDLLIGGGAEKHDSEAISAMRSARLMEALIRKQGLQATLSEKGELFSRFKKYLEQPQSGVGLFKQPAHPLPSR